MKTKTIAILCCAAAILINGCTYSQMSNSSSCLLEPELVVTGLREPECAVVDRDTGFVYVSNIEAPPEEYWSDNGKGFISRLKSNGEMDVLRWIDSSPDFILNSPKGMCILDGKLYVADNTRVVEVSIEDRRPLRTIAVPDSMMLNDMATDGSDVFVSDTGRGVVTRLDLGPDGDHETVAEVESVNGITFFGGKLFAVSWDLHELYEVDYLAGGAPVPFGLAEHFSNLDGIEVLRDGSFLVSDYTGNKISRVCADRENVVQIAELETPADFGLDADQARLFVPQLGVNRLSVYQLPGACRP